jgi:hypothetical protein
MPENITHRIATRIILTYAITIEIGRNPRVGGTRHRRPCELDYGGKQDHGMLSGYAAEVVPYCGDR